MEFQGNYPGFCREIIRLRSRIMENQMDMTMANTMETGSI